jgi:hypothetical protein
MKAENCGATIRKAPTQVRNQPTTVMALRQSGVQML